MITYNYNFLHSQNNGIASYKAQPPEKSCITLHQSKNSPMNNGHTNFTLIQETQKNGNASKCLIILSDWSFSPLRYFCKSLNSTKIENYWFFRYFLLQTFSSIIMSYNHNVEYIFGHENINISLQSLYFMIISRIVWAKLQ